MWNRLFSSLGALLVWSLAGCAPDDAKDTALPEAPAPTLPPPDEPGPYAAGTRMDLITTATGQPLTVQTWYPAPLDSSEPTHTYDGLLGGSALDEPAADCSMARPVVVFSHGNSGLRYQSIFLTEHLASRGWVVIAPDHEGNTAFDIDMDRWGELAVRRPLDLSQTFDWLADSLSASSGFLDGCIDPEAGFAVIGHSFGGYTSLAITSAQLEESAARACAPGWLCAEVADYLAAHPEQGTPDLRDARAWAAVPMTPAAFELLEPSLAASTVPTLVFGGTYDDITPMDSQVQPIFDALGAQPKHLATLETAGHFTFSDACAILPSYPDCSGDYMDISLAHDLIRGGTTAFLEAELGWGTELSGWLPLEAPLVVWESVDDTQRRTHGRPR